MHTDKNLSVCIFLILWQFGFVFLRILCASAVKKSGGSKEPPLIVVEIFRGASITVRIIQNAPGAGEALPTFGVALGAEFWGGDNVFGFKSAAPALELEDGNCLGCGRERIIRLKVTF